jgi:hypothetical protein
MCWLGNINGTSVPLTGWLLSCDPTLLQYVSPLACLSYQGGLQMLKEQERIKNKQIKRMVLSKSVRSHRRQTYLLLVLSCISLALS